MWLANEPICRPNADAIEAHSRTKTGGNVVVELSTRGGLRGAGRSRHVHGRRRNYQVIEASGGQVVVPTGVAHKSVNSGTGRLRQVDIHVNERFITEWLESWAGLQDKGDGRTTSP